jgi:hypothetical protein
MIKITPKLMFIAFLTVFPVLLPPPLTGGKAPRMHLSSKAARQSAVSFFTGRQQASYSGSQEAKEKKTSYLVSPENPDLSFFVEIIKSLRLHLNSLVCTKCFLRVLA